MTRSRLVRTFWLGAAALLVAAALIAIVALLRGELTDTDGKILATLGVLFLVGAAGLAGLALVDSGRPAAVGWTAVALSPPQFALLAFWVWEGFEGDRLGKAALSVLLVLAAELALVGHLLILSGERLRWLVWTTAALVGSAAGITIGAIWVEPESDALAKPLAVLWILGGLGWFLLPVLQRFTAAGRPATDRVLATLDDVELVATRDASNGAVEARLARGERLVLRRRS